MLRQGFDNSDAERPDVARRRDDSLRDFRRIVRAGMAKARSGNALLGIGGKRIRLVGVFGGGGNAVAGEPEVVFAGKNVRGPQVSMDQTFAMEEGKSLQSRSENVARFRSSERALGKKLREVLLSVFHQNVEQIEIAETATAGLEIAQQVRMGKFGGVLPAR